MNWKQRRYYAKHILIGVCNKKFYNNHFFAVFLALGISLKIILAL